MSRNLIILALVAGVGVAVVPELIPTGPETSFDAAKLLGSGQFFLAILALLGGGLLTALTPCVYPLIPITVSVFGARKAESRLKAVILTSSYIFGMGLVFAVLGAIAGVTGGILGSALQNPWVLGGLAVFMLVLATSMFGAFELALPQGLTQRLNSVGGSGLIGAFLMGSVSGFLAAPCTGPMVTGLLTFIFEKQDPVLGGALLFIYALGIGIPFFLIGVFALRLPKGGVWMEWVKSVLGIALVVLAIGYLKDASPALRSLVNGAANELGKVPGAAIMAVLTTIGVLAGAIHLSFKEGSRNFVIKALAVTLVIGAVAVRIAGMGAPETGALWVRAGLAQPPVKPVMEWHLTFPSEKAGTELAAVEAILDKAKADGRPVMIDFFAEWCAACKELDHKTYVADNVVEESSRFVNIKIDGTNEEETIEALYQRFGVKGLPTVAFISSTGEILPDPKVTGFLAADKFEQEMKKVR